MKLPKIMIGMPIGSGSLPWGTASSLITTLRACDKEGLAVRTETPVGSSVVQWVRSAIVESFLKSDFDLLFWIDADITWTLEDFFRIVGFGAVLDIVGAAYPLKKDPASFLINLPGTEGKFEVNGLGCIKILSMGIGFTLMRRSVVEAVAAGKPRVRDALNGVEYADVFRIDRTVNGPRGEDVAFFDDARELGFDAWLDPSIRLGHVGQKVYRGDVIDALGLQGYTKEFKR